MQYRYLSYKERNDVPAFLPQHAPLPQVLRLAGQLREAAASAGRPDGPALVALFVNQGAAHATALLACLCSGCATCPTLHSQPHLAGKSYQAISTAYLSHAESMKGCVGQRTCRWTLRGRRRACLGFCRTRGPARCCGRPRRPAVRACHVHALLQAQNRRCTQLPCPRAAIASHITLCAYLGGAGPPPCNPGCHQLVVEPAEPDPSPTNSAEAGNRLAEARRAAAAAAHRPLLPFCYVLHTSGSTGAPKGVCGTEAGVGLNLLPRHCIFERADRPCHVKRNAGQSADAFSAFDMAHLGASWPCRQCAFAARQVLATAATSSCAYGRARDDIACLCPDIKP